MAEEKKPSSLRGRVDRTRKTYGKPANPVPIIIGAVFVVVCGVALFFMFRGEPMPYGGQRETESMPPRAASIPAVAEPTAPPVPLSKDPKQAAYSLISRAKRHAKTDADAAVRQLEQLLTQYPECTPDVYHAMAMAVEEKIRKAGGSAPRQLLREKLDYLLKAKAEVDAGKQWLFDPIGNRTGNLQMSIKQAEKEANK